MTFVLIVRRRWAGRGGGGHVSVCGALSAPPGSVDDIMEHLVLGYIPKAYVMIQSMGIFHEIAFFFNMNTK